MADEAAEGRLVVRQPSGEKDKTKDAADAPAAADASRSAEEEALAAFHDNSLFSLRRPRNAGSGAASAVKSVLKGVRSRKRQLERYRAITCHFYRLRCTGNSGCGLCAPCLRGHLSAARLDCRSALLVMLPSSIILQLCSSPLPHIRNIQRQGSC
eukprot:6204022-Pleurochrysis_carterae.AAC.2